MRLPGLKYVFATLFTLTSAAQSPLPANQANRISPAADASATSTLHGHIPRWATPSRDLGNVSSSTSVQLTLVLSRSPQLQSAFDQLLLDQQDPASPRFHQWLTPQQVGEQYGPTPQDLAALTLWLTAHGLHVDSVSSSRLFLHASAPAATVAAVFQTSLHTFTHRSRTLMEPTSEPIIPASLAPIVQYIQGLAQVDYRTHIRPLPILPFAQTNIKPPSPSATLHPDINVGDGSIHWLAPSDFAAIYNIPSTATSSAQKVDQTGGQRVAVIGGSRLLPSDITSWENIAGLTPYQPTYLIPPASACASCSDPGTTSDLDQAEGTLDFERVYGTAPATSVDQIISSNWLNGTVTYQLIQYAIDTVNDPILTMSFGACESEQTPQYLAFENAVFSQAAAQGISVFASSGDSGAAGCEDSGNSVPRNQSTIPAAISDICSSTAVTCVGGTQFSDTASPSLFWSSTSSRTNGRSARGYIPEGAWNEPSYSASNGSTAYAISATGGGVSAYTAKPTWQAGGGVPADGARDVPDISFSASVHNGYFICLKYLGADCTQNLTAFGGTSASAPSMAGVAALLDQKLSGRQGNLNPLLYQLAASSPIAFHDATPATSGVTSCSVDFASTCNNSDPSATGLTGGTAGYPLTNGFDLATGLGSLDVAAFLSAAAAPSLPPTSTTLAASPTTISTSQTVVFTAAVASTSGTPTGTVQFTSNGTPLDGPIPLTSGLAETSSLSFPTPGTYTILAAYSGDSFYAPSSATLTFIVTSPLLPATSTTLVGSASSITTQQSVSYTATVSSPSTGTPTGSIQFIRTAQGVSTNLGVPIALSATRATLPAMSFPAGSCTITAAYSGDSAFTASTSPGTALTVTPVPTSTSIPASAQAVNAAQSLTFVATVAPSSPNSAALTGTVQFLVDNSPRGAPIVLSGTSATSAGITFPVGPHTLTAAYSGDAIFAASSSGIATVTSIPAPTSIAFTTAPPTASLSTATTFVVTVSGLSPAVASTGSVTFRDVTTGADLPIVTIRYSGTTATAALNTSFSAPGNHLLSARFNGDSAYSASPLVTTSIVVTQATVTLTPAQAILTVLAGGSTTDTITVLSTSFSGSQNLTCAVTYTGSVNNAPSCTLSPAVLAFSGSGSLNSTLTLSTTSAPSLSPPARVKDRDPRLPLFAGTLASLIFFAFSPRSRNIFRPALRVATLLTLASLFAALTGCGAVITTAIPNQVKGTTRGIYTVTINANSALNQPGNVASSTTVALTVQ